MTWLQKILTAHRCLTRPDEFIVKPPDGTDLNDLRTFYQRINMDNAAPGNFLRLILERNSLKQLFLRNIQGAHQSWQYMEVSRAMDDNSPERIASRMTPTPRGGPNDDRT